MSSVTVPPPEAPPGSPTSNEGLPLPPMVEESGEPGPEGSLTPEFIAGPGFFGWLKGWWTFDLEGSNLPPDMGLTLDEPMKLRIDAEGGFAFEAPSMTVKTSFGPFIARLAGHGEWRIAGELDAEGRVPMLVTAVEITRRELDTSNWNLPFDISPIVNGVFDLMMMGSAGRQILMTTAREAEADVLTFSSGAYGQRVVRPRIRSRVQSLTFLNEHGAFQAQAAPGRFNDPGLPRQPPHWGEGSVNLPVSYTRGDVIHASAVVQISAAGRPFRLFGISKTHPWMNFESAPDVSSGAPQTVTFHGKGAIPNRLRRWDVEILWNVQFLDEDQWVWAGVSGPHPIYVTHAAPILKNSSLKPNHMTPRRMDFVMSAIANFGADLEPTNQEIAEAVQAHVNYYENFARLDDPALANDPQVHGSPIAGHPPSTLNPLGLSTEPNAIWGLLDADNRHRGNCGEATMLMEQMLRLLGFNATQTHVYASSKIEVLNKGRNVSRTLADGSLDGEKVETRWCEHHKMDEELSMAFQRRDDAPGLGLNVGEGCVEVEGRLYSGILNRRAWDEHGRKAAYNMLLQLEELTNVGDPKKERCHFQIWTYDDLKGTDACQYASPVDNEPQSKPWGLPVPK